MTKYGILVILVFIGIVWVVYNTLNGSTVVLQSNIKKLQSNNLMHNKEPMNALTTNLSTKKEGEKVALGVQFTIPEDAFVTITSKDGIPLFKIQKTENKKILTYIQNIYDFRKVSTTTTSNPIQYKSTYTGYDIESVVRSQKNESSQRLNEKYDKSIWESNDRLRDFFTKNTAILKSSGTGDLPDAVTFFVDQKAYQLYFAPEGPNNQKIDNGKVVIVDYTDELSNRIGVAVPKVQEAVIDWVIDLYIETSQIEPPVYFITKMYASSKENMVKVILNSYTVGKNKYELLVDPSTNKITASTLLE